jgi:hypothetical protein
MSKSFPYHPRISTNTAGGITRFINSLEGLSPEDRRIAFEDLVMQLTNEDADRLSPSHWPTDRRPVASEVVFHQCPMMGIFCVSPVPHDFYNHATPLGIRCLVFLVLS